MSSGTNKIFASLFILALSWALILVQSAEAVSYPVINEFSASTVGTDVEYVEIYGSPSTDHSAYTVLEIEGDDSGAGVVDEVISLGTTDANGYYLVNLPANAVENGSLTLLLVQDFSGALGDDLDTNNDGILDSTPWSAVIDSVAIDDGGAGDLFYGAPVLGPNYDGVSSFAPGGASRVPDGQDTDTSTDWVRNDFDLAGIFGYTGTIDVGEAYNTPGALNVSYVPPSDACGDLATPIHDIQGNGLTSPYEGSEVSIEGIVVGDFQSNPTLNGFFVQEEDAEADLNSLTSEGIFVYAPGAIDVSVGDKVRVRGMVSEYFSLTELSSVTIQLCSVGNSLPVPSLINLPVTSLNDFERYEGMAVTLPQTLFISEYFNFDRFGEIVLTTERQFQPTAIHEPGSTDAANLALTNSLSRITLDDGRSTQNPDPAIHPNGSEFNLSNLFRGGDTVENVTGIMSYEFGVYRIHPTQGANYTSANPRTAQPDYVGGNLKVASVNTLNYFTTIDNGDAICGPLLNQLCRGADDAAELTRQRDKIIATLVAINADIVGLIEIENYPGEIPIADLVSGLNDVVGAGTYNYIATGAIGSDAIRNALIYKTATVSPVGTYAILDATVDPRFLDNYSRPALAQTFQDNSTGGLFTVAINHLKSKGSNCNAVGDPDTGDGSGNCNLTRKAAAEALVDWLASDPTGSGDADFLVIGDLNSYDKEDPIDSIKAGADDIFSTGDDYTDLIFQFLGEQAYSYLFDGQLGYLDHALATTSMTAQVTGATIWHINADEPDLIDYDMSFKGPNQDAIYAPDAYRSSDHDPVIVGLNIVYDGGCTLSAGYWKTHTKYGPAEPYDPTWDLKAGGDAPFLNSSHNVGYTWYSIMWVAPKKANAYIILAQQYIAAWLNINNVDPMKAADPSALGTALADAEALLGAYYPTYNFKKDPDGVKDDFTMLSNKLAEFNEGLMPPGACYASCPCWSGEELAYLTAESCVQSASNDYVSVSTVEDYILTTSGRTGELPECNVLNFTNPDYPIGFALAITYGEFLGCREGLEMLIDYAGIMCSEP